MLHASQSGKPAGRPVKIVEETDLLAIAPALVESGDRTAYNKFRQDTLDRYLPVRNSLQAEHILKACLLEPADAAMMDRLRRSPQYVRAWCSWIPITHVIRVGRHLR